MKVMKISQGNTVTLEYEGRFEDGVVFDSSKHGDHTHPLVFAVGAGEVIEGFDKAVEGMDVGEEKEFEIEPGEGYGEYNEDYKKEIPRDVLPKDQDPEVGMTLVMSSPEGQQFPGKIIEVDENKIIIDLNHPLAGKKLIFKIKIVDVE